MHPDTLSKMMRKIKERIEEICESTIHLKLTQDKFLELLIMTEKNMTSFQFSESTREYLRGYKEASVSWLYKDRFVFGYEKDGKLYSDNPLTRFSLRLPKNEKKRAELMLNGHFYWKRTSRKEPLKLWV